MSHPSSTLTATSHRCTLALAVGVTLAAGTAVAQMPENPMEEAAWEGERAGLEYLQREITDSALQFDEATGRWNYRIERADGTIREDYVTPQELRPGVSMDAWQDTDLADLYEQDIVDIESAAVEAKQSLETAESTFGNVYRITRSDNRVSDASVHADASIWSPVDHRQSAMASLVSEFGGCEIRRENNVATLIDGHTLDFLTCERFTALSSCERTREVETVNETLEPMTFTRTDMVEPAQIQINMLEFIPGGFDLADVVTELHWDGTVQAVDLDPPWMGNAWQGTLHITLDPEQFSCQADCDVNDPECECELTGVSQQFTAEVRATIIGLRSTMVSEPEGCLDASDGFCLAQWVCTDSDIRVIDGVVIGPHNTGGMPPLYPTSPGNTPPSSEDPFCWAAQATYDCPYNIGSAGCWITPSGVEFCHENTPESVLAPTPTGITSTCPLVVPSSCSEIASVCAGNATGHGNHCYVESVTYACRTPYGAEEITTDEWFDCGNETSLRCLGNDCLLGSQIPDQWPQSMGQVKGRAVLKSLQHMNTDYTFIDDHQNSVWTMAGLPIQCRKSLGGTLDNCNILLYDDPQDYLVLTDLVANVDAGLATLGLAQNDPNEPLEGSAQALTDPANHRWEVLGQRPFVSQRENVLAGHDPESLAETARLRVAARWGDNAADFLYSMAGSMPLMVTRSSLARAKEAFDISVLENAPEDWTGTGDEYLLARSKSLGACLHIGGMCQRNSDQPLNACAEYYDTFCCYDSHVARIFQQFESQIQGLARGGDFGTPEAPMCPGFVTLPDDVGMENLPLAEIIGWEARAGLSHTAESIDHRTSQDRVTGSGNLLGPAGRQAVTQRTQQRVNQLPIDQVRSTVGAEVAQGLEGPLADPTGPGQLRLTRRVMTSNTGRTTRIDVERTGTVGTASVRVQTGPWTDGYVSHPGAIDEVLTWSDGEAGTQAVTLELPHLDDAGTFTAEAQVWLSDPFGAELIPGEDRGRIIAIQR